MAQDTTPPDSVPPPVAETKVVLGGTGNVSVVPVMLLVRGRFA